MQNTHNVDIVKEVERAIRQALKGFLDDMPETNPTFTMEEIAQLKEKLPNFQNFIKRIPKPNEVN